MSHAGDLRREFVRAVVSPPERVLRFGDPDEMDILLDPVFEPVPILILIVRRSSG
jgi:hypothetical protein